MWHRTEDGRHYQTGAGYDELLDQGLNLLMGLPFYWSVATVRVSPDLVDQIIRKWGTLSSKPAVALIKRELADYASQNRGNVELRDIYLQLCDSVEDIEFCKSVQRRV